MESTNIGSALAGAAQARETKLFYVDPNRAAQEAFDKHGDGYRVALGKDGRGPWYVRVMDLPLARRE